MFDNIDPAKKQYFMFSFVVALLISIFINFFFVNLLKGSLIYGIPFNIGDSTGIGEFFIRAVDTIIMSLIFSLLFYFLIDWWIKRER